VLPIVSFFCQTAVIYVLVIVEAQFLLCSKSNNIYMLGRAIKKDLFSYLYMHGVQKQKARERYFVQTAQSVVDDGTRKCFTGQGRKLY